MFSLFVNFTLKGCGDNVIPSLPSKLGSFPTASMSKTCINVVNSMNRLDFAKFSPMQRRFPRPKKWKSFNFKKI